MIVIVGGCWTETRQGRRCRCALTMAITESGMWSRGYRTARRQLSVCTCRPHAYSHSCFFLPMNSLSCMGANIYEARRRHQLYVLDEGDAAGTAEADRVESVVRTEAPLITDVVDERCEIRTRRAHAARVDEVAGAPGRAIIRVCSSTRRCTYRIEVVAWTWTFTRHGSTRQRLCGNRSASIDTRDWRRRLRPAFAHILWRRNGAEDARAYPARSTGAETVEAIVPSSVFERRKAAVAYGTAVVVVVIIVVLWRSPIDCIAEALGRRKETANGRTLWPGIASAELVFSAWSVAAVAIWCAHASVRHRLGLRLWPAPLAAHHLGTREAAAEA